MVLGGAFCIVCGAPPPLFGDRICEGCFRKRNQLATFPENINWTRCPRCQSTGIGNKWVDISDSLLWNQLMELNLRTHELAQDLEIGIHPEIIDDRNTVIHIQIAGRIDSLYFEEEYKMRARKSNAVCITCSRRDGNYFEATLQLRSSGRKLSEDELNLLRSTLEDVLADMDTDPMFFVTKEGPVTGGYDVVLGSKGLAKSWARYLVNKFGGKSTTTASVVGRKDGNDLTRLTILYRKPGYELGDVIRWRTELWRVNTWTADGAILTKIERKEKTGATWRDLENAVVVSRMNEHLSVDPLNEDSSVAEFLNPENWGMESVRLAYDHKVGATIRVARIDGEWVALPAHPMDVNE